MPTSTTPGVLCMEIMDRGLELDRSGHDVVHFEKGELDFSTPSAVEASAVEALRSGHTRYGPSNGIPELREAIAAHYATAYSVDVDPARVFVNAGSSPLILSLMLALLRRGDEVIVPNPGYPAYRSCAELAGGTVVAADTQPFELSMCAEAVSGLLRPSTRAIFVNSPANPSGTVVPGDALKRLTELGPIVISDESYHGLSFGPEPDRCILEYSDQGVVVSSFSKASAMSGWRLGYAIVPDALRAAMKRVHQSAFISANAFVQRAGITALQTRPTLIGHWREELRARRDIVCAGLRALGLELAAVPEGAFYVLVRVPESFETGAGFASELLTNAHVAVTPGADFGDAANRLFRISFATSRERIEEGLRRIGRFLEDRQVPLHEPATSGDDTAKRHDAASCGTVQPCESSGNGSVATTDPGKPAQDALFNNIRGFYVTRSLLALHRLGVLGAALDGQILDVDLLALERELDADLLDVLLRYLSVRGYFEEVEVRRFRLSELGRDSVPHMGYVSMLVGAYDPVFNSLEEILSGEVRYAHGVRRRSAELADGVSSLEDRVLDRLVSLTADRRVSNIVDLGCGSGRVLTEMCERHEARGIGVDIDAEACETSKRRVGESAWRDHIEIRCADAARLGETWTLPRESIDVAVAMFLMHELLGQRGRGGVVAVLRSIRSALASGGRLLLVEVSRLSSHQRQDGLTFVPEYQLVHDFSCQALATQEEWAEMLGDAGLAVEAVEPLGMCRSFCMVAGPMERDV